MRIALFITCYNDLLFPEVGQAMVRLLRRLGHDVEFPAEQTCCGQMHFNSGYQDACIPLVERFTDAFAGYDVVVTPSGSCAAMVRHHHWVVAELGLGRSRGARRDRRAARPRAQRVPRRRPRRDRRRGALPAHGRLPSDLPLDPPARRRRPADPAARTRSTAFTLVDLPRSEACCGFGGTFAVKNADTSVAMGLDKVDDVLASGAEVLTAGDTSCLMHIGGLLSRRRSPVRVMHLAEILAATEGRA